MLYIIGSVKKDLAHCAVKKLKHMGPFLDLNSNVKDCRWYLLPNPCQRTTDRIPTINESPMVLYSKSERNGWVLNEWFIYCLNVSSQSRVERLFSEMVW